MNLLLLRPEEVAADGTAVLAGRRLLHAREVLQISQGDALRVGVLGGLRGEAEVISLGPAALTLRVKLAEPPPARAGVDLLLALPRPKALRKIVPAVASFGVSRLFLINASRVEKSGDLAAQVTSAFRFALSREPSKAELEALTAHAKKHGLANACRVMLNLNEFGLNTIWSRARIRSPTATGRRWIRPTPRMAHSG